MDKTLISDSLKSTHTYMGQKETVVKLIRYIVEQLKAEIPKTAELLELTVNLRRSISRLHKHSLTKHRPPSVYRPRHEWCHFRQGDPVNTV